MAGRYEQFVAFGTDIIGLERLLRFMQALFMITTSWPSLITLSMPTSSIAAQAYRRTSLLQVQAHLNVARRWMRVFRFLDTLNGSWILYVADGEKGIETWLDIVGKTSMGMFGLLESITLPDLSGVQGFDFFGPETSKQINRQAQGFWLAALYCSIIVSGLHLIRLFAYQPVPQTGSGYGTGEEPSKDGTQGTPSEKANGNEDTAAASTATDAPLSKDEELLRDRNKLRAMIKKRKTQRVAWVRHVKTHAKQLGLKMLSDVIDTILPLSALGWINIDKGLVGVAMLTTSVLTSMGVWARLGSEIDKKKA